MAFSSLNDTLIQVSKAVKREIFTTLKDNQDDLNSRLLTVETGANKVVVFDTIVINATSASSLTGLAYWTSPSDFTLLDAKVGIFEKGSLSGTIEFDVKKSVDRDPANFSSVFTTRPSITMAGASDYDDSTNAVFNPANDDVLQNNVLRLDITSLPSPVIGKFSVYVIGEIN